MTNRQVIVAELPQGSLTTDHFALTRRTNA